MGYQICHAFLLHQRIADADDVTCLVLDADENCAAGRVGKGYNRPDHPIG